MSAIQTGKKVEDAQVYVIQRADFYQKKVNESIKTPEYEIPQFGGLRWWVELYPAGFSQFDEGHVGVFFHVNKPGKAELTCYVHGVNQRIATYEYVETSRAFGWHNFASRQQILSQFSTAKYLTIGLSIVFESSSALMSLKPSLFESCGHVDTDLELVMDAGRLPVHKSFLSLMSPVFHAMFTHDTTESKSGKVKITDIDFEAVKAAIDFCYGLGLKDSSIDTVVGILRFADKYDIKAVTIQLESFPRLNLSVETFSSIFHYAYDCSKQALLTECIAFFKEHRDKIKTTEKFARLPIPVVVHLLKTAFDLKSTLKILQYAYDNEIEFVLDPLEQPLLQTMTIDNFCPVVDYAWKCSRDDLKNVCATFFNDNMTGITKLKAFYGLPAETFKGVMHLAYTEKTNPHM